MILNFPICSLCDDGTMQMKLGDRLWEGEEKKKLFYPQSKRQNMWL